MQRFAEPAERKRKRPASPSSSHSSSSSSSECDSGDSSSEKDDHPEEAADMSIKRAKSGDGSAVKSNVLLVKRKQLTEELPKLGFGPIRPLLEADLVGSVTDAVQRIRAVCVRKIICCERTHPVPPTYTPQFASRQIQRANKLFRCKCRHRSWELRAKVIEHVTERHLRPRLTEAEKAELYKFRVSPRAHDVDASSLLSPGAQEMQVTRTFGDPGSVLPAAAAAPPTMGSSATVSSLHCSDLQGLLQSWMSERAQLTQLLQRERERNLRLQRTVQLLRDTLEQASGAGGSIKKEIVG